ncbi:hypothetical protein LCI18_002263 [Fusarium solani-melongenae]|uniref:Uncharacterized protein n=1 Tax=Fusarium solani subsp. cucurbitae TaxID=2747967 RepID=A0ACD3YQV0_FUSSC|nr:hypothetical protein LCI18_002263 [Fusarium solani-melongenae]
MSGHLATTWFDTVLSDRDNHSVPVVADSSPPPKRRRLQPSTPESPTARTDDGTPVVSGTERPTHHLPDTHEEPQTSQCSDCQQIASREPSSPSPAPSREDQPEISDEMSSIGSVDDDWFGVKERELDKLDPLPPSLEALLKQIRQFSDGIGILPTSARRRFKNLDDNDMEWARQGSKSNKYYSKERQALGELVSPAEVRKIVNKQAECYNIGYSMTGLDMGVNSRVLDLAFERLDGYLTMSNSLWIAKASIDSDYSASCYLDEQVDFCIYLELESELYAKERNEIDRLYNNRTVINHTTFGPLGDFPLALSINTEGDYCRLWRWESALWACLKDLVKVCTADVWETDPKPSLPEFLPAIFVKDDDWNLVVTTHKGKGTTIWHRLKMGSTSSVQGIYQIIACLHTLRQWGEGDFWPWFRELLLQSRRSHRAKRLGRSRSTSVERYGYGGRLQRWASMAGINK